MPTASLKGCETWQVRQITHTVPVSSVPENAKIKQKGKARFAKQPVSTSKKTYAGAAAARGQDTMMVNFFL
jgi:hypothetical protein